MTHFAGKNKTNTDSDFEEDDVPMALVALRLLKKANRRSNVNEGAGTGLNLFYPAPATGVSKNLLPEIYDTLDSCWRQSTDTGIWRQKTGECVITIRLNAEVD